MSKAEFLASLPYPATAIRILGDGGYVVLLNVPENELGAIAQLALMRQSVLKVTIEDIGAKPPHKAKKTNDHAETEDRDRYFTG
jgi:hypothetical protein